MSKLRRVVALLAILILTLQGFAAARACHHGFPVPQQAIGHGTAHDGHEGHAHHHPADSAADGQSATFANSGDAPGAGTCALCAHCAACFAGLAALDMTALPLDAATDYGAFSPAAPLLFDPEQPQPPPLA